MLVEFFPWKFGMELLTKQRLKVGTKITFSYLIPARFGGGEFISPIRISYVYGKHPNEDAREGPMVTELTKKLTAVEILRNSDFGETVVGGTDRVGMAQRIDQYQAETEANLEMLRAFEVF